MQHTRKKLWNFWSVQFLNTCKKQYPWCLKLKLLDLVWFRNWSGGGGGGEERMAPLLPLPQWLRSCKFQLFWFSPTGNYNRCVWSRPVKSSFTVESLPVFIDFFRSLGLSSFSPGICCFLYWINLWFEYYFIHFTKFILLTY